jgi:hypothetical protein
LAAIEQSRHDASAASGKMPVSVCAGRGPTR